MVSVAVGGDGVGGDGVGGDGVGCVLVAGGGDQHLSLSLLLVRRIHDLLLALLWSIQARPGNTAIHACIHPCS